MTDRIDESTTLPGGELPDFVTAEAFQGFLDDYSQFEADGKGKDDVNQGGETATDDEQPDTTPQAGANGEQQDDELSDKAPTTDEPSTQVPDRQSRRLAKIEKRISKLVYERNSAQDRIAEQQAEIEALKQRLDTDATTKQSADLDSQYQTLLQQKQVALDIADHAQVVNIDEKLLDIREKKARVAPTTTRDDKSATEVSPDAPNYPAAMVAWEDKNSWVYDPQHKDKLEKANTILKQLGSEGYTPDDPDTYVELDLRLAEELSTQTATRTDAADTRQPDPDATKEAKPSPSTRTELPPTTTVDRGQEVGKDKAAFSNVDRKRMEAWGLNPDDPRERAAWLKNKQGGQG